MTYYDRDGKPISQYEWTRLFADKDYQIIEHDHPAAGVLVSTVWLGIDHNFFGDGPPIIFESMVFGLGDEDDLPQRRYATEEQAREGHATLLAAAKEQP